MKPDQLSGIGILKGIIVAIIAICPLRGIKPFQLDRIQASDTAVIGKRHYDLCLILEIVKDKSA